MTRNHKPPGARIQVAFELDVGKDRIVLLLDGRAVNVERSRRFLFFALQNLKQRVTLRIGGLLTDETLDDAAPLVDRARPAIATTPKG